MPLLMAMTAFGLGENATSVLNSITYAVVVLWKTTMVKQKVAVAVVFRNRFISAFQNYHTVIIMHYNGNTPLILLVSRKLFQCSTANGIAILF